MSVLLKFYLQKVFSKIKTPKKAKERATPLRKNRNREDLGSGNRESRMDRATRK
ncbi:MAG: hypothetical protein Q7T80_13630 [Methanoregula sp.]|nr:hypothetical protein [Methanoregula sp.]